MQVRLPEFVSKNIKPYLPLAYTIGIFVWGGYTLLYYLGIPVHQSTLMPDAVGENIQQQCASAICRGALALFPALRHTLARAEPFLWYAVLCILLYGGFVAWKWVMEGRSPVFRFVLRPWQVLAAFFLSLWLLFTTLSLGSINNVPVARMIEPRADVYTDVTPETLQSLQDNFSFLQGTGCLREVGANTGGAGVFDVRGLCMQEFFISRVVTQLLVAIVFLFELLIAGHMILTLANARPRRLFMEAFVSAGVGTAAWIAVLWTLATFGLFVANAGWFLVLAVPVLCYRSAWYWLKIFMQGSGEEREWNWYEPAMLVFWLLVTYFALNFLTVIRPFPIGWDDLGSYLNRPRLLVSYGSFVPSMAAFQWEYLTALGFLLFGYSNPFAATASMVINWTEGFLAVVSVFLLANLFLGPRRGMLASLFFYALPLVGHFSFADMKIDNAVFAMGALATILVFLALFPDETDPPEAAEPPDTIQWKWFLLAGLAAGLAFSMKPTAIMVVAALVVAVLSARIHWLAFIAGVAWVLALFIKQRALDLKSILDRAFGGDIQLSQNTAMLVLLLIGAGCMFWACQGRTRAQLQQVSVAIAAFFAGAFIIIVPWNTHNHLGSNSFRFWTLQTGYPNTLAPVMDYAGDTTEPRNSKDFRQLPKELAVDINNPACKPTGAKEELDRYWGYGKGLGHYVLLPWRSVMNLDTGGYYVTTLPALLMFPLLLLLPAMWDRKRWLRYVFATTAVIVFEWIFLANGIPWYGVGMFLGLAIGMEALVTLAPNRTSKIGAGVFVGASLIIAFGLRIWQFEQQRNILEYSMGKISAHALSQRTIPWYDGIQQIVVGKYAEEKPKGKEGRPYLYRVGTFIPYFIPKNLEVIAITDHQLDVFSCLNQEQKPELTMQRLKALGFSSLVFDTNTATIELDPNGTLHKKVQKFVDFLNTPNIGIQVVVNDPSAGVAFVLFN